MSAATKSALLLVATLVIGLLLGFIGAGTVDQQRRGPRGEGMRNGRPGANGLVHHMEEVIQPRDSAQRAQIHAVLERAAERNRGVISGVNVTLRASMDSMKAELQPLLSADQRDRLERATNQLPPVGMPPDGMPGRGGRGPRGGAPPGAGGGPPPEGGPPPQ